MRVHNKLYAIGAAIVLLSASATSRAQIWDHDAGDEDWFNPVNWDANTLPDGTIDVTVDTSGEVVVVTDQDPDAAAMANSIFLGTFNGANGQLTITDDGALTADLDMSIAHGTNSTGTVIVSGTGSNLTVGAGASGRFLKVGYAGNGSMTVEDGGTVVSDNTIIGDLSGAEGTMLVTGSGTTWADDSQTFVGNLGTGSLAIDDGAAYSTDSQAFIGRGAGSEGNVSVSGAGSAWDIFSQLYVGDFGDGSLSIEEGATVSVGHILRIGVSAGATGTVTVTGAGSSLQAGYLPTLIGNVGTGSLTVENGATAGTDGAYVGNFEEAVGSLTVTGTGSTVTNTDFLYIGSFGTGEMTISNGGVVTNTAGYIAGQAGSEGTVLVTGTGSTWTNSGNLSVGYNGTGSLTVEDGATGSANYSIIGDKTGADGTTLVTGTGTTWTDAIHTYVGNFGSGSLTIADGAVYNTDTSGFLGVQAGSQGSATVTGTGSTWNVDDVLHVGREGTGTLAIEAGATVTGNGLAFIGDKTGSMGTVLVTGTGSSFQITDAALIGQLGTGSLSVEAGAMASFDGAYIGDKVGGQGSLTVTGAGSVVTNTDQIYVGNFGTGDMNISDGGVVTNTQAFVGGQSGSEGTVLVTGTGSTWTNSGNLIVGNNGTGSLTVEDGGTVSNTIGHIGDQLGSVGTVVVTGAGSAWNNSDNLFVGNFGTGDMTVSDGGTVTNVAGFIGRRNVSEGTVLVTGTGSTWTNSGNLTVGYENTGSLTIADGGMVSNQQGTVGGTFSKQGSVLVTGAGSSWIMTDVLNVGYRGMGDIVVEDGAMMSNTSSYLGDDNTAAVGTVRVTGLGSAWYNTGAMYVGNNGTGELTVADWAVVEVGSGGGTVDLAAMATAFGTLNIGAASGDPAMAPGTLSAAMVQFGDGTSALVFNHTDDTGTYEFAPGIASGGGSATVDHYAGFTRLTGDSSGFFGPTTVYGGTLAIENMLGGSVAVMSGATLGGSGTANYDVGFDTGSYYLVEMDGTTADQGLTVQGTATLDGTVMLAGDYASIAGMGPVVILSTDTALGTTFDGVTADSIFLTPTLSYEMDGGPDYVFVSVEQDVAFADIAETRNQRAVGGALDTLPPGNSLYNAIALMDSADTARDAYDQLSGEAHASLKGALVENGQRTVAAVNDRIHNAFEADDANTSVSAYGDTADTASGFWMTGYGNWMTTDATGNTAEMSNDLYGVIAGIDHRIGEYGRLGLLGGYSRTNTSVDALASEADADSYTVGLYGGADNGNAAISLGALYTWHSIESNRYVTNPVTEMLNADYDARSFQFFAEAGYKARMDRVTVEPFAGVSYINLNTDSFSETGGTAALSSSSETTSTTFTTLGLRSSIELASNVHTRGMIGWRHAFGDVDPASTFTIGGSGPFSILGAPIAQDAAVLEAGIDFKASDNVTIGASYEGQYGDGAIANGFNARLLAEF